MSKNEHTVYNAALIMCVDGAWIDQSLVSIAKRFGQIIDFHTIPGAAKYFNYVSVVGNEFVNSLIDNIVNVSMGLHRVPHIVLLSHWNCGAYGGSSAFISSERQAEIYHSDLLCAKEFISKEIEQRVAFLLADENTPSFIHEAMESYDGNMPKVFCLAWQPNLSKKEYELVEVSD